MRKEVITKLKTGSPEQNDVVGPLVDRLVDWGWDLDQIYFGKKEWRVPKTPSEASKREKGRSFDGFPVDIAVFDSPDNLGDPPHLLFIIECKLPNDKSGKEQLQGYFVGEPHAKLGVWCNNPDETATAVYYYRGSDGRLIPKPRPVSDLPRPGQPVTPTSSRIEYSDLIAPSESVLRRVFEDILADVVIGDTEVNRREDQTEQLCSLVLLKLESDKEAKASGDVFFQALATPSQTAKVLRKRFDAFVKLYPAVFTSTRDRELRLSNSSIHVVAESLGGLKLLELGLVTVSLAFQVLRADALKSGEGQYFTPERVIQAGVKLAGIRWEDIILDPAAGTGGFLVESLLELQRTKSTLDDSGLSKWAQTHIYGIDKDPIGVKLTKAIMQIAGDGSAHCVRGDSVRTHLWGTNFKHLDSGDFENGRFSLILTNPPFGKDLKVKAEDLRLSHLDIAEGDKGYRDTEIGIVFLQRSYDLLSIGGRLGIVLPETYLFSPSYRYVREWLQKRFRPLVVANVPMAAFQGFCRAKTSFYVFEKIDPEKLPSGDEDVTFLNPDTCGIYKDGALRFKTDPKTGERTKEIDDDLTEHVALYKSGKTPPGSETVKLRDVWNRDVYSPAYWDHRPTLPIRALAKSKNLKTASVGDLIDGGILTIRGGHGSPGNDQRKGEIPYIKVSDLRALRINVNPTNFVPRAVAEKHWKDDSSGLCPWDVISPNRASSNIGEFAILLPGEEEVVLTKEMFVIRVVNSKKAKADGWDPFYLLWALSLKATREQWKRIILMQTNREDCGKRHLELLLPLPKSKKWAVDVSEPIATYFKALAKSQMALTVGLDGDDWDYSEHLK